MCGIVGIVGDITPELADRSWAMLAQLAHRGPDDHGWLSYSRSRLDIGQGRPPTNPAEVMLLHRRLSILDLSEAGRQPMTYADGRYYVVTNGEIYNYIEVRNQLLRFGFTFRTETDTEVLIAAFSKWGVGCLRRFNGMFAFALFDTKSRKLFLARDPFGIKPLYYSVSAGTFSFASEIKALLQLPAIRRDVNPDRLFHYLRAGLTDFGEETLFRAVHQLPPAHYLELDIDRPNRVEPTRYWQLDPNATIDLSFDEATDRLRELFRESIRLHMRSHVAVGASLSGGIDSSAIVMAMNDLRDSDQELHTFSFITGDEQVSDEDWIDLVAAESSATVHKVRATPEGVARDLDAFIATQDEPVGGPSVFAQYLVFRQARAAGIKVVLDGQGSDEIFAGYDEFLIARLLSLMKSLRGFDAFRFYRRAMGDPTIDLRFSARRIGSRIVPHWLHGPIQKLLARPSDLHVINRAWFDERGVATNQIPKAAAAEYLPGPMLREMFFRTQLPMQLRYEDRNAMAFGVENRVPFLTLPIVEFVFGLPEEYLIGDDGTRKLVLRAAMRGIVPDAILDRKEKRGFQKPHRASMLGLRPYVERVLSSNAVDAIGALDRKRVREQWEQVVDGNLPFDYRVWRWINVVRWAELRDVRFES